MADLRYPVGEFSYDAKSSPEQSAARIDELLGFAVRLREQVRGLSDEQLDTPYRPGGWSTRQISHHVADSTLNTYVRIKLAITENRPRITAFDQDAWALLPDATTLAPEVSAGIVEAIHARIVTILRGLEPRDFSRTVVHPERGEISVDYLVQLMHWHARHHIAQIEGLRKREGW